MNVTVSQLVFTYRLTRFVLLGPFVVQVGMCVTRTDGCIQTHLDTISALRRNVMTPRADHWLLLHALERFEQPHSRSSI